MQQQNLPSTCAHQEHTTMLLVGLGLGRLLKEKQFTFLGGSALPPLYRHFKIVWLTKNNSIENKL